MSTDAPTWFVEQYKDGVIQKYQAKGFLLKSSVTPAGSIEGSKAYFNLMGKGKANKKKRGQAAVPMNAQKGRVEAILETWEAFDEVYKFDLARMTANEKEAIQTAGAMALGRATDDEIMVKLDGSSSKSAGTGKGMKPLLDANGQPGMIGGAATPFELKHLLLMASALKQADVPWDGNVFCPLPSLLFDQACAYKQFNNADWTGDDLSFTKVTTSKFWAGVHWFQAPDDLFLENEEGHYDIEMYHRSSSGWANNSELSSIWDWDNRLGCWTVRMETEGAAACFQPTGTVRGRFKVPTDIALN
nr:phage capsid protein [uncultured Cohaesibacter sp.]